MLYLSLALSSFGIMSLSTTCAAAPWPASGLTQRCKCDCSIVFCSKSLFSPKRADGTAPCDDEEEEEEKKCL